MVDTAAATVALAAAGPAPAAARSLPPWKQCRTGHNLKQRDPPEAAILEQKVLSGFHNYLLEHACRCMQVNDCKPFESRLCNV